jgi:hypothetical protein
MRLARRCGILRANPITAVGRIFALPPITREVKLFCGSYFRRRMDPDGVSRSRDYAREMVKTFDKIGKTRSFWQRPR